MRKDKALLRFLSNPQVIARFYSPSISRSIPEVSFPKLNEWAVVIAVSAVFLVLILSLSLQINGQIRELARKQEMRQTITSEITYWENVTSQYPGYRDGYFRLALLRYQLGEGEKAMEALDTALRLDPRFEAGISLRERLSRE